MPNTSPASIETVYCSLKTTKAGNDRLRHRLARAGTSNWVQEIRAQLLQGNLKSYTRMLHNKSSAPAAHESVMEDEHNPRDHRGKRVERFATSNMEQLKGTAQKHQDWTGRGGEEQALFQVEEAQNAEGFTVYRVRDKITNPSADDLRRIYKNPGQWITTPGMAEAVKGAYNNLTGSIFSPTPINPLFSYKYRPDITRGEIKFKLVEDQFWKAIEKIPGKARHRSLHMALLARAPIEWARLHLRGICIVLAARIAPRNIKQMSR